MRLIDNAFVLLRCFDEIFKHLLLDLGIGFAKLVHIRVDLAWINHAITIYFGCELTFKVFKSWFEFDKRFIDCLLTISGLSPDIRILKRLPCIERETFCLLNKVIGIIDRLNKLLKLAVALSFLFKFFN